MHTHSHTDTHTCVYVHKYTCQFTSIYIYIYIYIYVVKRGDEARESSNKRLMSLSFGSGYCRARLVIIKVENCEDEWKYRELGDKHESEENDKENEVSDNVVPFVNHRL